jgi:anti-sigma regulatory factor (Ser/Thr protein kinase)
VQSLEVTLPGTASSVPPARHFVERTLEAWGLEHLSWTAALLVTELAANAALHAGTDFRVVVTRRPGPDGERLRVEVHDGSSHVPRARRTSDSATTGRGLRMVADLAADWGVAVRDGGGKAVWWELPTAPPAALDDDDATDVDALLGAFADVEAGTDEAGDGRPALARAA